ncbi:MAG TPA: polysaccharide deacetylase family protein [Candidatus Limnocylindrales bacterium]|nr:polysaccharide deacetylase family protein [Candidatus Limnocylindrales bacterium]
MTATVRHPLASLLTVMWHYVRDPGDMPLVAAPGLDPATFDAQLDHLARYRTIVDWPAVAAALDGGAALPADAALLTFDDGLADHAVTVMPRLVARGWRGVFFVLARRSGEPLTVGHALHVVLAVLGEDGLRDAVTAALTPADARRFAALRQHEASVGSEGIDILKRPLQRELADTVEPILRALVERHVGPSGEVADALHLSPDQIAAMRANGQVIGGHGRRHLWFDHEPAERVAAEIRESAHFLAHEPRPWAFAYPYGAADGTAARQLEVATFGAAFHAAPMVSTGRFDLGRIDGEDPRFLEIVRGPVA